MKFKTAIIFIGDFLLLYGALALTLLIRYGVDGFTAAFLNHFNPFSLIFIIWIAVFFLADFYQVKVFKDQFSLIKTFVSAITISTAISVIFFYFFYQLTPKTNLAIFAVIFGILDFVWRSALAAFFASKKQSTRLLVLGDSPLIASTISYLKSNPQLGYSVVLWLKDSLSLESVKQSIKDNEIKGVIVPFDFKKQTELAKTVYELLPLEVKIINFREFYELIYQKVPLEELEQAWFVEGMELYKPAYDTVKRIVDVVLAFILSIVFLPIVLISAFLIKIFSPGPVIFQQDRNGQNNKHFIFYKLRTMKHNVKGLPYTTENDERVTGIGRILRYFHLDEVPQLYNILKGDISFIGPRPEYIKLAEHYSQLPHYNIRHTVKPGLSGWAQLNYKASTSLEEAHEKLKYDIYYIKNRSLFLDLVITFKTLRLFL